MAYCQSGSIVNVAPGSIRVATLKCKAWTCPECRPMRQSRLVAEAVGGNPTIFLTLTSRKRDDITREEAARQLSYAWRLTRLRLLRRTKRARLPFLAVFEETKNGWPHLHIVLRTGWLDRKFISDCMQELISSPVVDLRKIDAKGRVAAYVAKYVGKDCQKFGTSKRYWKSKDYEQRTLKERDKRSLPNSVWTVSPDNIRRLWSRYTSWEWQLEWVSSTEFVGTCVFPFDTS